ncbi:hypothetical protein NXF25_011281 [Crotalus adamanteus]|uniref:Reverse transcriptase domain-containing protein n=1 Tax=Crotalus adamanteus TaxID=8729 RepID=A0AAW1BFB3_CROAD
MSSGFNYCTMVSLAWSDVQWEHRAPFVINIGIHQGLAVSSLLFVFCMDTVTLNLQSPHPWSLLYANDIFLVNEQCDDL